MATSGIENIINSQSSANNMTGASSSDKDMFLTLLVTQLQNQDPLNPTEDTEFITQLAQFTQVEKLEAINKSVDNIYGEFQSQQLVSSSNLIGKLVLAKGSSVAKGTDSESGKPVVSYIYYTNDEPLAECNLTITNSANQIVWSQSLGAQSAGSHAPYTSWPGTDMVGNVIPDGIYTVAVTGTNIAGKGSLVETQVYGQVTYAGLINGDYYLSLNNGTEVKFTEVTMISQPVVDRPEADPEADPEES